MSYKTPSLNNNICRYFMTSANTDQSDHVFVLDCQSQYHYFSYQEKLVAHLCLSRRKQQQCPSTFPSSTPSSRANTKTNHTTIPSHSPLESVNWPRCWPSFPLLPTQAMTAALTRGGPCLRPCCWDEICRICLWKRKAWQQWARSLNRWWYCLKTITIEAIEWWDIVLPSFELWDMFWSGWRMTLVKWWLGHVYQFISTATESTFYSTLCFDVLHQCATINIPCLQLLSDIADRYPLFLVLQS